MAYTVHTKNRAPETGFSDEPVSSHKSAEAALEAAKEHARSTDTYGTTVMVLESGTNNAWSVTYVAGEPSIGYDEGTPYLIPAPEAEFVTVFDAREEQVEVRQEKDETTGAVAVFLDSDHELYGEFTVTTEKIEV